MRVLLLPGDRGGCGLYRMIAPGRAVVNSHADVEMFTAEGLTGKSIRDRNGNIRVWSIPPIEADVVVFQRPLNDDLAAAIPLVQAQGVAVVVEIDDDFRNVHSDNTSARYIDPQYSPRSNWNHLMKACDVADMVTVSTQSLTRYAPHGRVRVVKNYLPRSACSMPLKPHEDGTPVRIGWTGAVATHPHDLTMTRGAVANVLNSTGSSLRVVGSGKLVASELGLKEEPWASGWVDLPNYPQAIMDNIDVGIVPLMDIPFNHAKSNLKGLEYAAFGKPFVASATAEYLRLADRGVGLIARGGREWYKQLYRLVQSADYRQELSETGRDIISREFTIEQHAHEWYDAWSAALANRDARMREGSPHVSSVG